MSVLKCRLQGTKRSIKQGVRLINKSGDIRILRFSRLIPEEKKDGYYRLYVDLVKDKHMDERTRKENGEMCRQFFEREYSEFSR